MGSPRKHIVVVGSGPGGLSAAMLLAARGFKVTLLEKDSVVGGRNASFDINGYKFDTGPTFLMMKFILDEIFWEAGRDSQDYLDFFKLDPMYRLEFYGSRLEPTTDHTAMRDQIARVFPGNEDGFNRFLVNEQTRYEKLYPCLQKDYTSITRYLSKEMIRALPYLGLGKSVMDILKHYFTEDDIKLAFTFQSKYLGMSAWECPGAFAMLPFVEHKQGIYHTMGGLCEISNAMAKVCKEHGVEIRLNTPVKELFLEGKKTKGVKLEDDSIVMADEVVLNADFGYAMQNLVPEGALKKYKPDNLIKMDFSCSTFMLYLGLDKIYNLPHHTIYFAKDYRQNIEDVFQNKRLSKETSLYIRNASITDSSLAPEGHSAVYVLVPVPNLSAKIDWAKEKTHFRERILKVMEIRGGMTRLRSHIKEELVLTPDDWEAKGIYLGATFNLSHKLTQMLYLRPHNRFEELDNCYLVGGGTHPGSGLPTIYESGRIAANMICHEHNVQFVSKNKQV
jgi:phytoene desaturase